MGDTHSADTPIHKRYQKEAATYEASCSRQVNPEGVLGLYIGGVEGQQMLTVEVKSHSYLTTPLQDNSIRSYSLKFWEREDNREIIPRYIIRTKIENAHEGEVTCATFNPTSLTRPLLCVSTSADGVFK